ncbi:lipoprotein signal peptidase [Posidoniimonas corsicana]|uniref:Lipoprotein signal peptidase n=1 Tax=Posidoniimonas corsicana TaxID=1938618 RepID=A0A5C5VE58_9BACT|nr:lipoprotein signal peptidase [Posidoniimonas corsicana]
MPVVPRSRIALFLVVAALATLADLWSKHAVFSWPLLRTSEYWLVQDHAGFQLSLNEGGLFGMGQGAQFWLAGFSVLAALAIPIWLFRYKAAEDLVLTVTLAFVMGGILGNLYDRLGLHGLMWGAFSPNRAGPVYAVRDFILLAWRWDPDPMKRVVWPNFNVADSFLVVGAAVLFFRAMAKPDGAKPPADSEQG